MTREGAKRHIKAVLAQLGRPLTKTEKDAFTIAYNCMDTVVIKCKQCKHYHENKFGGTCDIPIYMVLLRNPDDFCSRAERREDEASENTP